MPRPPPPGRPAWRSRPAHAPARDRRPFPCPSAEVANITAQPSPLGFPDGGPPPRRLSLGELRALLREDFATNRRSRRKSTFFAPGFQAIAVYRLGVWAAGLRPALLRAPFRLVIGFFAFLVRNFYGIELYPTAEIGRRFGIVHQHGIVIHQRAVIGDDCLVRQGVTIGAAGSRDEAVRPPRLGDRVKIGAGAVIAGPISIGDDVTIGPNAVVMTSVPAGSMVTAPPARIMTPPPRRAAPPAGTPAETSAETSAETTPARDPLP